MCLQQGQTGCCESNRKFEASLRVRASFERTETHKASSMTAFLNVPTIICMHCHGHVSGPEIKMLS